MKYKSEQETTLPSNAYINALFCKPGNIKKAMWLSDSNPSPSFAGIVGTYMTALYSEDSTEKVYALTCD